MWREVTYTIPGFTYDGGVGTNTWGDANHWSSNKVYASCENVSLTGTDTIDLCRADGSLEASVTEKKPARQPIAKLLTQMFPTLIGQDHGSGYLRVTASKPVAASGPIGMHDLSVLSTSL